jgi:hypothetical protein
VVEVEGIGAQHNDFKQDPTTVGMEGNFGGRTEIREGTINVPVGPAGVPAAMPPEAQGGGANLR